MSTNASQPTKRKVDVTYTLECSTDKMAQKPIGFKEGQGGSLSATLGDGAAVKSHRPGDENRFVNESRARRSGSSLKRVKDRPRDI